MTSRRARRGFTLLEVMVALGILAGSLLLISDVVGGALRNHVRARHLEVAALLARARMVQVEEKYEAKGFAASDESDEGAFDEEGHPEIRWKLEITAPPGNLDPDQVVRAVTGMDPQELVPAPDQAPELAPFRPAITAALQTLSGQLGDNLKKGLRLVRLTVSWPEDGREESFEVRTHMLVLAPGELAPR